MGSCGKRLEPTVQKILEKPSIWSERYQALGGGIGIVVAVLAIVLVPLTISMFRARTRRVLDQQHRQASNYMSGPVVEQPSALHRTDFQLLGRETWCRLQDLIRGGNDLTPFEASQTGLAILEKDSDLSEDEAEGALLVAKRDYEAGAFGPSDCPEYEEKGDLWRQSQVHPF